jgi:hypothetical protein
MATFVQATNDSVDQINKLADKIEQIPDCKALEELIKGLTEMIQAQLTAMLEELARQAALAIPPTSLSKLIKWAKKIAAGAYAKYIQLIQLYAKTAAAFARILSAIQEKLANLDCRNIRLPTLDSIIPPIPQTGIFLQVQQAYSLTQLVQSPDALISAARNSAGPLLDSALGNAAEFESKATANTEAETALDAARAPADVSAGAATKWKGNEGGG